MQICFFSAGSIFHYISSCWMMLKNKYIYMKTHTYVSERKAIIIRYSWQTYEKHFHFVFRFSDCSCCLNTMLWMCVRFVWYAKRATEKIPVECYKRKHYISVKSRQKQCLPHILHFKYSNNNHSLPVVCWLYDVETIRERYYQKKEKKKRSLQRVKHMPIHIKSIFTLKKMSKRANIFHHKS